MDKALINVAPATNWNRINHMNGHDKPDSKPIKASTGWDTPEPVELPLPAVESITADMIPAPLRGWLEDVGHRMQVPLSFVAAPAIVLVGSVIGSRCTVRPKVNDDWTVVPNLWGGVVGTPSMLKTPSLKESLRPLAKLENDARTNHEIEKLEYSVERDGINAQLDGIKASLKKAFKDGGDTDILKAQLREVKESEPTEPALKRYRTNDATVEKLAELCQQNPEGILVFRDELVGLLASFEKDGHEQAKTFYLEGWSGDGSYTVDRIQRGTEFIKKICLSVFGGIQPEKLNSYLRKVMQGDNDGFIQRFQLLVYPDEPKRTEYVDKSPNIDERERAQGIINTIDRMDFTQYGARLNNRGGDVPHFQFSAEAQQVFVEYYMTLQNRLSTDEELTPIMREHLGKYRSLMPSLALIFHLIDVADGNVTEAGINLASASMAVRWCEVLETHANRIYNGLGNASNAATLALSKKIKKGALNDGFTARDIARKGWAGLNKTKIVDSAISELCELDWLRAIAEESQESTSGRPKKPRYAINPELMKTT